MPQKAYFEYFGSLGPDMTRMGLRIHILSSRKTYFEYFACIGPDMARMGLGKHILSIWPTGRPNLVNCQVSGPLGAQTV